MTRTSIILLPEKGEKTFWHKHQFYNKITWLNPKKKISRTTKNRLFAVCPNLCRGPNIGHAQSHSLPVRRTPARKDAAHEECPFPCASKPKYMAKGFGTRQMARLAAGRERPPEPHHIAKAGIRQRFGLCRVLYRGTWQSQYFVVCFHTLPCVSSSHMAK